MSDNGSISGVGVIDKAMRVVAALETDGPHTLNELVDATGLSRPTAHRLAAALEKHGLVRRDTEGRFALGLRLLALGQAAVGALSLREAARPALEELRDRTGESAQLYVRQGESRICIEALESPHGLRTIVPVGAVLPLDRGSAGKVLRGGGENGLAASVGEREAGVASVSAAVRDHAGRIHAAVSVSGPIERLSTDPLRKYAGQVALAAQRIAAASGLTSAHASDRR
jgi:DNA-binding IclR family transcriptional regulator